MRQGAVLVSEPFAFRHGLPSRGGTVELLTDRGLRSFPVAGVFYDYATEQGLVLLSRNVYERLLGRPARSRPWGSTWRRATTLVDVTRGLREALAGTVLQVTPNRSLRARALEVFDRTFAVTQALRLLAVIVAFIGVWSALLALQVERTRELATLEVLGLGAGSEVGPGVPGDRPHGSGGRPAVAAPGVAARRASSSTSSTSAPSAGPCAWTLTPGSSSRPSR